MTLIVPTSLDMLVALLSAYSTQADIRRGGERRLFLLEVVSVGAFSEQPRGPFARGAGSGEVRAAPLRLVRAAPKPGASGTRDASERCVRRQFTTKGCQTP